jgi:hypothetical protein
MKKRLLIAGAMIAICLSGCSEKDDTIETTTRATTEAITTEATTTETEAYSDYEITYTNVRGWVNVLGDTEVQVVAEIENTGTTALYISGAGCELEDKKGNLVKVVSNINVCPQIIQPNEKGYIFGQTTVENYLGDDEIDVIIRPEIEELKIDDIRYDVSEVTLFENDYGVRMQGRITNTSDEVQSVNYVEVVYFDNNHKPIGYSGTMVAEEIQPNAKIGFEVSGISLPDFVTMETISDYLIYSHPMQFQY